MDLTVADLWRAKIATELYADKLMDSSIEYRNNGEDTYADNYEDGAEAYARLSDRFHKAYRSALGTLDSDSALEELWAKQGGN